MKTRLVTLIALMLLVLSPSVMAKAPSRLASATDLGYSLSLGVLGKARGAKTDSVLTAAQNDAKLLGVTLPKLPAMAGDKTKDTVTAMHYLLKELGPVAKGLKSQKEILLMEVGIKSNLMRLLYTPGDDHGLAKILGDRCKRIGVAAGTTSDLSKAVAKKAPDKEITGLLDKLEKEVRAYAQSH